MEARQIRLTTDGKNLVHETVTPPFTTAPDVIFWGSRTFMFVHSLPGESAESPGWDVYREAFAFTLTDNPNT